MGGGGLYKDSSALPTPFRSPRTLRAFVARGTDTLARAREASCGRVRARRRALRARVAGSALARQRLAHRTHSGFFFLVLTREFS